jgi:hypothetical protein
MNSFNDVFTREESVIDAFTDPEDLCILPDSSTTLFNDDFGMNEFV